MERRIPHILLAFCAAYAAASAGEAARPIVLPGTGLAFSAPPGWSPSIDGSGNLVRLSPTGGSRARAAISGSDAAPGEDLDAAARRCRDDLARLLPDFQVVAADAGIFGGQPWRILSYRFSVAQEQREQRQYIAIVGGKLVVATLDGCSAEERAAVEAALAGMAGSRAVLAPARR